jgi:hypothetical protein
MPPALTLSQDQTLRLNIVADPPTALRRPEDWLQEKNLTGLEIRPPLDLLRADGPVTRQRRAPPGWLIPADVLAQNIVLKRNSHNREFTRMCFEPCPTLWHGAGGLPALGRTSRTSSRHPNCSLVKDRTTHPPDGRLYFPAASEAGRNLTVLSRYVKWRGLSWRKKISQQKPAAVSCPRRPPT